MDRWFELKLILRGPSKVFPPLSRLNFTSRQHKGFGCARPSSVLQCEPLRQVWIKVKEARESSVGLSEGMRIAQLHTLGPRNRGNIVAGDGWNFHGSRAERTCQVAFRCTGQGRQQGLMRLPWALSKTLQSRDICQKSVTHCVVNQPVRIARNFQVVWEQNSTFDASQLF